MIENYKISSIGNKVHINEPDPTRYFFHNIFKYWL